MNRQKAGKVNEFMARLDHPLKAEVEAVRQIILGADGRIREEIKWNAPSFFIREHFATFHLRSREFIQIIFHRGARVKDNSARVGINDPEGILVWLADDRCAARFSSLSEVEAKEKALGDIVRQWIEQVEPAGKRE